jgi:hypothetical protein
MIATVDMAHIYTGVQLVHDSLDTTFRVTTAKKYNDASHTIRN